MHVTMYTDGAARGNPDGPGGYGIILQYTDEKGNLHEREFSEGFEKTTNNRMELLAVIVGLKAIKVPCDVTVVSDSKYVTDAFNKKWIDSWVKNNWKTAGGSAVKNIDLWQKMLKAKKFHTSVTFQWVRGHCGNELNERCDKLATAAADKMSGYWLVNGRG